ncbi:MAG: glycosyltransferase [Candidatus Paceibacterota bacterium]|jgi:glycosyltransferase involved in cell wall biosynthesis
MENTESRKLNVAMICDPIGDYKAGVLVSAMRFSKLLAARGHKIIFIGARDKLNKENGFYHGIKTYRFRGVPLPKSDGWHLAFPTVTEIKEILIKEKIDIIHLWLPMSGALVATKAARALGIKIVAHSHSQPENLFSEAPKWIYGLLAKIWNKYLAWLYGKADAIIYPSELGREILHHLCGADKHSVVISNGVNTEEFKPADVGDFYERFNIPRNQFNLVYVGRLFPEKSVQTFIKALPLVLGKYPKSLAIIAGTGHLQTKLENLSVNLGVKDRVRFLGRVSDDDLIKVFNLATIFVSPSLAELEGMTVLEAMACGKPIITTDAEMNAARFFVTDNGLLFEPENVAVLAEKIGILLADDKLRAKMSAVSLEKARQYDIHQSVIKLENLYYSLK